jgi:ABC-type branched-subunit amino acid transport system ATPase component
MRLIKKFLYLLSGNERKKFILLIFMIFIVAIFEMLGVASIMPFIAVLTNPSLVETNIILINLYSFMVNMGLKNNTDFVFFLGVFLFFFLTVSILFKALTMYAQFRFILMCEYTIGKRVLEKYLRQPYVWFLSRNSSDLGKNILSELQNIVANGALNLMILLTQSFVFMTIISLLLFIEPNITLIIFASFSLIYFFIYKYFRSYLKSIGQDRFEANKNRFKAINVALGSSKELKINGLEKFFLDRFSIPARKYATYQTNAQLISLFPRLILEILSFGGMLILILFLLRNNNNFVDVLPVITLFAFAGYRLMPAIQQIYNSITQIKFVEPALDQLYTDYKSLENEENIIKEKKDNITVNKYISLKNVNFIYPNYSKTVLNFDNLTVKAYSSVALVGTTGSGKTTALDFLSGLLKCDKSLLEVDGNIINSNNLRVWQKSIGYVPQQIYLVDDTVASNIAFGINADDINYKLVEDVAKIANIDNFILNDLPQKYKSIIGERGIKLSGGQRQRIGIARALYRKPKVLILDEATSALDNHTETLIVKSLEKLDDKITIIMVAHRLSTVKNCNKIFLFDNGEIKAEGTFNELSKTNNFFFINENKDD